MQSVKTAHFEILLFYKVLTNDVSV